MPYTWSSDPYDTPNKFRGVLHSNGDAPAITLRLTAYNSLTPKGFGWFIGITAALMCVPLVAFLGSVSLWIILACLGLTLGAVWMALTHSWKRGSVTEQLFLWSDKITLRRRNPDRSVQDWDANPYWVRVEKHETGGPVPQYLTLAGAERTIEIGAFLSEQERAALYFELKRALLQVNQAAF